MTVLAKRATFGDLSPAAQRALEHAYDAIWEIVRDQAQIATVEVHHPWGETTTHALTRDDGIDLANRVAQPIRAALLKAAAENGL